MTAPVPPSVRADIARGIRSTWGVLAGLPWEEGWGRPTPLPGWSVGDIAGHLVDLDYSYMRNRSVPGRLQDLHQRTAEGVERQRRRPPAQVRSDLVRMAKETPDLVDELDDWQKIWPTAVGDMPAWMAFETRLGDLYVHLLDLSEALGTKTGSIRDAVTERALARRVMRLSGWAAVRMAGLTDGTRIRLTLTGPGASEADLVVEDGRGRLISPEGEIPADSITGDALALILAAGGRAHPAEILDDLRIRGGAAASLVARFHLFG